MLRPPAVVSVNPHQHWTIYNVSSVFGSWINSYRLEFKESRDNSKNIQDIAV